MSDNPILDDLHATRQKLLEDSGGTLAGLVARLQAEQEASGRTILKTRQTKRYTGGAKSGESEFENCSSLPGERMEDREEILNEIQAMLEKPNGKLAVRFILSAMGGIPIAGSTLAAAGSTWAELEQQLLNKGIVEWAKLADGEIAALKSKMTEMFAEPTKASMALLLGEILGGELAENLLSGQIGQVAVMLSPVTIDELGPYIENGWIKLSPTHSVMNLGAGNSIGGHVEERKRPHGLGKGFVLTVAG